jgi:predicted dehydrogenase
VLEDREVPIPLEDAVANMQVIEALISSARSRSWVNLETSTTT